MYVYLYLNVRSSTESIKGSEVLTLDAVRSAIRFQKCIAEGWIKAIEGVTTAADHKVIDIFVLLILYTTGNRKKTIESLFRNKIRSGHFTEELLRVTFNMHSQVVREYFASILSLSEVLLRSPEPPVCHFGCTFYKHAFTCLDLYCKQEIVGALVTHIGSGYAGEVDSSLDILSDLVDIAPAAMAPFAVFIKSVLDYLDNLSISQIRKLFSILSNLAFRNNQDTSHIQDDIHIVVRKQLTSASAKYKRIGVIGAIMLIHNMAYNDKSDEESVDQSASLNVAPIGDENYKQVISLLELVRNSSSKSPEAAALFFDELSAVISGGDLDSRIQTFISESVLGDFQDDYIVDDTGENTNSEGSIPMQLCYSLDEDSEGGIVVNLLSLLGVEEKSKGLHLSNEYKEPK
ncbi:Fanconi anemia group D2 protein-like, partial [Saccoglossus kowalevskii]